MSDPATTPDTANDAMIETVPFAMPRLDHFPGWLVDRKNLAWDRALTLPTPTRSEPNWRFASLRTARLDDLKLAADPETAEAGAVLDGTKPICASVAGRMVFLNDVCLQHSVAVEGVEWMTLEEALERHGDLMREHFMRRHPQLGSEKFVALHEAMVRTAAVCVVRKGVEVKMPLEITRWHSGAACASFPHTFILAEPHSKVTVLEVFRSREREANGWVCGMNDIVAGEGARVTYAGFQVWNQATNAFHLNSTEVGRDAHVTHLSIHLGGAAVRGESVSRLSAPGGRSDMLAVNFAENDQEYDQRTLQDHLSPHTTSDLLYKNVLTGKSRTIFAGLIRVRPGAHQTDAYQKARNLLLSDDAEANSMPGLEILADEVRCSHGATSGQIDPSELFYLRSRGIDRKRARRLIAYGFLNEVLQRLPGEQAELTDALARRVAGHLERRS